MNFLNSLRNINKYTSVITKILSKTFNLVSTPTNVDIQSVVYGNSVYVQAGYSNNIWRSTNGSTWTSINPSQYSGINWLSCHFVNNQFIAISLDNVTNRLISSTNGSTWTTITATTAIRNIIWRSIAYSSQLNLYVAVANQSIMTSSDAVNWNLNTPTNMSTQSWISVAWSTQLNLFVAVADIGTNRVAYSSNGTTWTLGNIQSDNWFSVNYCFDRFIATAYGGGDNRLSYSLDGITWTAITSQNNNGFSMRYAVYCNGVYVIVGQNKVLTSTDGINYVLETNPTFLQNNFWSSVATDNNGNFVISKTSSGNNGASSVYGSASFI